MENLQILQTFTGICQITVTHVNFSKKIQKLNWVDHFLHIPFKKRAADNKQNASYRFEIPLFNRRKWQFVLRRMFASVFLDGRYMLLWNMLISFDLANFNCLRQVLFKMSFFCILIVYTLRKSSTTKILP